MAKVITFSTNSNNQFTIITIFKTKLLSNIAITCSIVSSFTYFPNPTTISATSPMHPLHIQHPCRNPMVETALDKLHPDKHSCIVFPDIISVIFAEGYGSFHLLIPSLAVLRLLFKHHKDFSSDNLHLLASGL